MEDGEGGSWDGGVHGGGRQGGDGTARAESQIHGGGVSTIHAALGSVAAVILWGNSFTGYTEGRSSPGMFSAAGGTSSQTSLSPSLQRRGASPSPPCRPAPPGTSQRRIRTLGAGTAASWRLTSVYQLGPEEQQGGWAGAWGGRRTHITALALTFQICAI